MKKIYQSLGLLLALSLATSCYTDHSIAGDRPLDLIVVSNPIAEVQTAVFGEVTVIKAPEYKISTGASVTPSYEWIVDGEVASTEKDFAYKATTYGEHDARLRIYTPDGSYFYRFKIDVPYRYLDGLYVLAGNEGKAILSYLPGGEKGKDYDLDAFGRTNPKIDMTGDPQSLVIYRYKPSYGTGADYVGIALGTPSRYYRLSAEDLTPLTPRVSFNNPVAVSHANSNASSIKEYFITGANLWEMEKTESLPTKRQDARLAQVAPGYSLAESLVNWRAANGVRTPYDGIACFDNHGGKLLYVHLGYPSGVKAVSVQAPSSIPGAPPEEKNPFEGMTLVDMASGGDGNSLHFYTFLLLKRTSDNKYFIARLRAGDFAPKARVDGATVTLSEFTEGTPVRLLSNLAGTAALVATSDKVYFYNMSNTGTSTHPAWISLPAGKTIASMVLTADNRLFIGANGTGSGLVGSIYSYNVEGTTPVLLKSEEGVTGKIKQMIYRQFNN